MAVAQPSVSNRPIENVRIVHSEENLDHVVRRLAVGLEENLKLPGQADYDREVAPSADYVVNQLKKVYDVNAPTVLYISDDFLKLFKKKKKQVDMLKSILQKDAETQTTNKNIVILWGELKDKDLVKKVLGIDYSKIQKGQFCDLQLANFSLNEVGNIVEAVLKLWSGPDAELPTKPTLDDTSSEIEVLAEDTWNRDHGQCETNEEVCRSTQSVSLHVCAIHFDQKDLHFVSEVAFHLMQFMKLQKSVDFFSFYEKDDPDMISTSLAQLEELQKPNEKAVVIINKHLVNLLKSDSEAMAKFEYLCLKAVEQTNNVVFLLKNLSHVEVKQCSESLAEVISRKCNVYNDEYEDKNHLETAVFDLTRFLRDGAAIENDESVVVRCMKEEYADYKGNVVGSDGDSISAALMAPMSGPLSRSTTLSNDQGTNEVKMGNEYPRNIVASNGDSLHITGMEKSHGKGVNHGTSNNYQSGSQTRSTIELHATPTVDDSDRTVSKLDGFSGYYQAHQMQHSSSEALSNRSFVSSSETVQEQPLHNGVSTNSGRDIALELNPQSKSSHLMENDKDGPLALRSRATSNSSHQIQSAQHLAASKMEEHRDLKKPPHIQQTPPPAMFHGSKSEPTHAPTTPTQYPGVPPTVPGSYSQRTTIPAQMLQHPASQQSVPATNYGVSQQMYVPGYQSYGDPRFQQSPVPGQVPHWPHIPDSNHQRQHQSQVTSATQMSEEEFSRLLSNPEIRHQLQRQLSLQSQQTGVPVQPLSALAGEVPRGPLLHTSRSTPDMTGSNLAVPMGTEVRLLNLNTKLKHDIGIKLNSSKICGYYWKHFAEAMGVNLDVIRNWESIQCNYMDKVFEWLGTNNEEYTVSKFRELARRFERPDIVKLLSEAGY